MGRHEGLDRRTRGASRASWRLFTWLYIVWSIVPVIIAVAFSFNDGRSRTAWQGFSLRWYYHDPLGSVWQDDDAAPARCTHSLELAVLRDADRDAARRRARARPAALAGRGSGTAANALMLMPLVTPELVMGASLFLLFTQLFGFIGLGTPAR